MTHHFLFGASQCIVGGGFLARLLVAHGKSIHGFLLGLANGASSYSAGLREDEVMSFE